MEHDTQTMLNTKKIRNLIIGMYRSKFSEDDIVKAVREKVRLNTNERYIRDNVRAILLEQKRQKSNYANDTESWREEAIELLKEGQDRAVIGIYITNRYFADMKRDKRKNCRDTVIRFLRKAERELTHNEEEETRSPAKNNTQGATVASAYKTETTVKAGGEIEHEKRIPIEPSQIEAMEKALSDEASLLKFHNFDDSFTIVSAHHSIWESPQKGGGSQTLCASKIKVKKRGMSPEELLAGFDAELARRDPPVIHVTDNGGDNVAVLSIADLHLGKLAWGVETGENYDHKIAAARYNYIIDTAISLLRGQKIEKIIFFWSQDFFQYDTVDVATTAGTRQDSDVRWAKLFALGCDLLTTGITKLATIAPVDTFYTRSNHDEQSSFYANSYLWAYFRNTPGVSIDRSPRPRKYRQYGVNLFGFGHGDKEGKRIEGLMQIEAPKEWGDTWNREFFLGHYHSLRQYEANGITFRYLQSPTGTDAWHAQSGYLGAGKCAQLFVRNKHAGPVMQSEIYIPKDLTE